MTEPAEHVHVLFEPDAGAMREHLEHMFGGYLDGFHDGLIELAWTDLKPDLHGRYPLRHASLYGTDAIEQLIAEAVRLNRQTMCNVYIGAALRKPKTFPNGRASASDVLALTCAYADLDDKDVASVARKRWGDATPTKIVITGREPHLRAQMWWRLDECITDQTQSETLLKGIAAGMHGDPTVTDAPRVMRLAGSIAWPMKPDRKRPEITSIAHIKEPGQPIYSVEHLARVFPFTPIHPMGDINVTAPDGIHHATTALGLEGKVDDGRERYMLQTANAVLIELIGTSGQAPTGQGLFDAAWPQYERSTDLTRSGRGADEFAAKCAYTVKRFAEGKIRGCETIEVVQALYRQRAQARGYYNPQVIVSKASEPPPQPLTPPGAVKLRSAFPIDRSAIPVRDWAVPGLMLKKNLSMLVAPPGSGKSLLSLQWSIMEGVGIAWAGWAPRKPEKTLVINAEDDFDEMQRRLVVAADVMQVKQEDLAGRVLLAEHPEGIVIARHDSRTKSIVRTPLVEELIKTITELEVGVVVVDPFAETFEGDESNNSEVKWAGILWREVARRTNTALVLVHHTRKYAADMAGNADASRGGGSMIGIARILVTLFDMTEDEATAMDVAAEDRTSFVRFDDAKANHNKKGVVRWFEKKSINLGNGNGLLPGDDVGVLVPWHPPDALDGVSTDTINLALDAIDRGPLDDNGAPQGQFFTARVNSQNKGRWAGTMLTRMLNVSEDAAKTLIKRWLDKDVLETFDYTDPIQRKGRTGVRSVIKNRPGITQHDHV